MSSEDKQQTIKRDIVQNVNPPRDNKVTVDFKAPVPSAPEFSKGFFKIFPYVEIELGAMANMVKDIILQPRALGEFVRANTFPELIRDVTYKLKMKIADETLSQFNDLEIERQGPSVTEKSLIKQVEKIDPKDSIIPWGLLQSDAALVGSEKWTISHVPLLSKECAGKADFIDYRVNYFVAMDGDFFYTDVVPHTFTFESTYIWLKYKAKTSWQRIMADGYANEVHLTRNSK